MRAGEQIITPLDREEFRYLSGFDNSGYNTVIKTEEGMPYTYIMKSEAYDNLYKFGRTTNLKERLKTINASAKFRKYRFAPFAIIPSNREQWILMSLCKLNITPLYTNVKDTKHPEAYYLREEDLDYIIDVYHFHRVDKDNIPGTMVITTTEYMNIYGWITKVDRSVTFK